jgi:hypothetical protein
VSLIFSLCLFITLPSHTVHADFNQKGGFLVCHSFSPYASSLHYRHIQYMQISIKRVDFWCVTHFLLMPLHYITVTYSTCRFQSKGWISARIQGNMSFVADGGFLMSAFIASQCQPFGKLQDSKIYSV